MRVPLFSVQVELQVHNSQEGRSACGTVGHSYSPGLLSDAWFSPEGLERHVPGLPVGMHYLSVDYGFTPSQMLPWLLKAPLSSTCHGTQKALLLVFHLRETNIVSMYLQNYNIPYIFPKLCGLGYSLTLRKGSQRADSGLRYAISPWGSQQQVGKKVWPDFCAVSLELWLVSQPHAETA